MDWASIWKIVLAIISSVGGAGVIIIGLSKFLSERIAERLQANYQLEIDKRLEEYKAEIEQTKYIKQAYFDKEMLIYQELCEKFNEMIECVSFLFPYGMTLASQYEDENELLKNCNEKLKNAGEKYRIASIALFSKAAFIPKDFYAKFDELRIKANQQIFDYNSYNPWAMKQCSDPEESKYKRECVKRTQEIFNQWDNLIDELREYLKVLSEQKEK